jgi:hypothetical protein
MSNTSSDVESDSSGYQEDDDTKWWTVPDRRYSKQEVQEAYQYVKTWNIEIGRVRRDECAYDPHTNKSDNFDFSKKWGIMHILTSDDAWAAAGQRTHLLDVNFKIDVREFFRAVIYDMEGGERPVAFMKANIHKTDTPSFPFIRLLRSCLLRFPDKIDKIQLCTTPSFDESDDESGLGEETRCYTALQLAASSDRFPVHVLETLLQAGADVDKTTTHGDVGDTPLMLALMSASVLFPEKVDILLDYGADITTFNWYFENALHIAASNANVRGLRTILEVYNQRLTVPAVTTSVSWCPMQRYWTRLRKTGTSQRLMDTLQLGTRHVRDTPLSIAAGHLDKTRLEMVELLVNAGADANSGADSTMVLGPHGWIQYNEYDDLIEVTIRHGTYDATFQIDPGILLQFYDPLNSTRKPEFIDAENAREEYQFFSDVFKRLSVDGGPFSFNSATPTCGPNFDIHFALHGDLGWKEYGGIAGLVKPKLTLLGPDDPRANHKIAIRFEPGPWTDVGPSWPPIFYDWRTNVNVGYTVHSPETLAHRAVSSAARVRTLVYATARSLCNPLLTCEGLTAVGLFRKRLSDVTTTPDSDTMEMLAQMQEDHDDIMTFIRKECPLCATPRRKRTHVSRFDMLPDEVVEKILSFM